MMNAHTIRPKVERNPLILNENDVITEPALYEYAFPTPEICFEVVKVEDNDYVMSDPETKELVPLDLPNSPIITTPEPEPVATPVRRSKRTPKRKVMKEYEFTKPIRVRQRGNELAKKRVPQKEKPTSQKRLHHEKKGFAAKRPLPKEKQSSQNPLEKESEIIEKQKITLNLRPKTPIFEPINITTALNQNKKDPPKKPKFSKELNNGCIESKTQPRRSSGIVINKEKNAQEKRPAHAIRYDKFEHFPSIDIKKRVSIRCKNENCKGKSRVFCLKCKLHLCLKRGKNCFHNFHTISSCHKQ